MFEYNTDTGSIFKAGTVDEVAEICQGGIECLDRAIRAALELAFDRS